MVHIKKKKTLIKKFHLSEKAGELLTSLTAGLWTQKNTPKGVFGNSPENAVMYLDQAMILWKVGICWKDFWEML